jgi:hypothetical protein
MSNRFYQVYQCHSPSGGMSAVDETRYATVEEARAVAEAMKGEVSDPVIYDLNMFGCKVSRVAYPTYWAQALRDEGNFIYLEFM